MAGNYYGVIVDDAGNVPKCTDHAIEVAAVGLIYKRQTVAHEHIASMNDVSFSKINLRITIGMTITGLNNIYSIAIEVKPHLIKESDLRQPSLIIGLLNPATAGEDLS